MFDCFKIGWHQLDNLDVKWFGSRVVALARTFNPIRTLDLDELTAVTRAMFELVKAELQASTIDEKGIPLDDGSIVAQYVRVQRDLNTAMKQLQPENRDYLMPNALREYTKMHSPTLHDKLHYYGLWN